MKPIQYYIGMLAMNNLLSLTLFAMLIFSSTAMFAQSRPRLPFPKPEMICQSTDGNFRLSVHPKLALIRVYDNGQKSFSHSIRGLEFKVTKLVVYAYNHGAETDLPKGIVFAANMTIKTNNAYTIDDRKKSKSRFTCSFTK